MGGKWLPGGPGGGAGREGWFKWGSEEWALSRGGWAPPGALMWSRLRASSIKCSVLT